MKALQVGGVFLKRLGDLNGEFARGCEHQRLWRHVGQIEFAQNGQCKGGGLAGAGLRLTEYIAAGEQWRNGLRLNGRRRLVAHIAQGLQQGRMQLEIGKADIDRRFDSSHGRHLKVGGREVAPSGGDDFSGMAGNRWQKFGVAVSRRLAGARRATDRRSSRRQTAAEAASPSPVPPGQGPGTGQRGPSPRRTLRPR